jgi:hypothetical protein
VIELPDELPIPRISAVDIRFSGEVTMPSVMDRWRSRLPEADGDGPPQRLPIWLIVHTPAEPGHDEKEAG